jgi:hypothetical protein
MASTDALGTYLQDHLGGANLGVALAERLADTYREVPLGPFVTELARDIAQDKAALEDLMGRLGIRTDALKEAAGWIAEKAGRLKLSDAMTGDPDLKRLLELEVLAVGIEGKIALWHSLLNVADSRSELAGIDIAGLAKRAEGQRAELEEHRLRAASDALAG